MYHLLPFSLHAAIHDNNLHTGNSQVFCSKLDCTACEHEIPSVDSK